MDHIPYAHAIGNDAPPTPLLSCPHLFAETDTDTMTSLGVPVSELDVVHHVTFRQHHLRQVVGMKDGHAAHAVFPTWDFLAVEWAHAAALARLVARAMGLTRDQIPGLPHDHLIARLLRASFPVKVLENTDHRRACWSDHLDQIFGHPTPVVGIYQAHVLVERQEAADMACLLARHIGFSTLGHDIPHPFDGLLHALIDTALPKELFLDSGHASVRYHALQNDVLEQGRDGLPARLTIPDSPFGRLPL